MPPLDKNGKPPRPSVLLLGQGEWQGKVSRELRRSDAELVLFTAGAIRRLAVPPALILEAITEYLTFVDVVAGWIIEEGAYLDEWTTLAWVCGKAPDKLVLGADREANHPMTPSLLHLAQLSGAEVRSEMATFVASVRQRLFIQRRG